MSKTAIMALLICTAAFAQQRSTFTDSRDGKKYKYTTIGKQTWMAENLNYAGKNDDIGVCYDKKIKNCEKYGTLYTWEEAKKICPSGWHLPNNEEWETLMEFAGGEEIAGKKLRAKGAWKEDGCKYTTKETTGRGKVIVTEHDDCATDEFGFLALPGSFCDYLADDGCNNTAGNRIGDKGIWWSTNEYGSSHAYYFELYKYDENYRNFPSVSLDYTYPGARPVSSRKGLLSVRCLKN